MKNSNSVLVVKFIRSGYVCKKAVGWQFLTKEDADTIAEELRQMGLTSVVKQSDQGDYYLRTPKHPNLKRLVPVIKDLIRTDKQRELLTKLTS